MTPERLDYLANLYAGHSPATELVAEIRRLWTVRDAARETLPLWGTGHLTTLRDALAAYDAAADRHPGQMGLGEVGT
jgi:hypothetical protein